MPQLFNLYLQITDPATIAEYQDVDPEVITDDLQYGSLLEACTLKDPSVHPALQLLIQVQMPDIYDDEGEYLPEEVLKELRLSHSGFDGSRNTLETVVGSEKLSISSTRKILTAMDQWLMNTLYSQPDYRHWPMLRQGSTVSRTCSRKA